MFTQSNNPWAPELHAPYAKDKNGEHWHGWGEVQVRLVRVVDVFKRSEYDDDGRLVRDVLNISVVPCPSPRVVEIKTMPISRRLGEIYDADGKKLKPSEYDKVIGKTAVLLYCFRCWTILRVIQTDRTLEC